MTDVTNLQKELQDRFSAWIESSKIALGELTVEVKPEHLLSFAAALKTDFAFDMLIDVCGIDYLHYGLDEWQTASATESGFSRGTTDKGLRAQPAPRARFAVVYHFLSIKFNRRIRMRVFLTDEKELMIDSVIALWPAADWFEREVFDLFGILFRGHPDLRRLLTDYGFVGHPFRKDFPLIGRIEARYDATLKRVVYDPVSIEMRVLEPKVIRHDNRYDHPEPANGK